MLCFRYIDSGEFSVAETTFKGRSELLAITLFDKSHVT